eukprot:4024606-Pleurochrysis_carterae.AAC.1
MSYARCSAQQQLPCTHFCVLSALSTDQRSLHARCAGIAEEAAPAEDTFESDVNVGEGGKQLPPGQAVADDTSREDNTCRAVK